MEKKIEMFGEVIFTRRTGRIRRTVTGGFTSVMKWDMMRMTPAQEGFIFSLDDGKIVFHAEGNKSGPPAIIKHTEQPYIQEYCDGLLEAMREQETRWEGGES